MKPGVQGVPERRALRYPWSPIRGYILDMALTPYRYTSPYDPDREDDGLFGPHSVTWRIMSSRLMWVAVLRALYLQALHPRVIRGTLQNAATITEPVDAW